MMYHTFSLYKRLYESLPPLVPKQIKESMKNILILWENNPEIKIEELENIMIKFGYEVWPYNQAFNEIYKENLIKQGEHFFLSNLSEFVQQKYFDFKSFGGTLEDLVTGSPAEFFDSEQRLELCSSLVNMKIKMKEFTKQEIIAIKQKEYLNQVNIYKKSLKNIQKEIKHLYKLAQNEKQHHPNLSAEISEKAKNLEFGLCLLGPEVNELAVCDLKDFFAERKIHLDGLRGIHLELGAEF